MALLHTSIAMFTIYLICNALQSWVAVHHGRGEFRHLNLNRLSFFGYYDKLNSDGFMSVYFMKGISVILTAFNRRDYLNDPLDSLINQDFDKTMMEIILVKNFSDKMIDDKIAEYGGKLVYSDSNFGRMVADAIELATKDIIAFLDDDDFF